MTGTEWKNSGWLDRQAQTQGVSESAAVAACHNLLAWGKHATTLAILTQIKSQKGFNALYNKSLFFYVKWIFEWNWQDVNADQSSTPLCSIFRSVIGLWVKIRHRNKAAYSESNPVQSSRSKSATCRPVLEKGVCSDLNWTAQQLQMAARKSLETISSMILNWLQPKFAHWPLGSKLGWQSQLLRQRQALAGQTWKESYAF